MKFTSRVARRRSIPTTAGIGLVALTASLFIALPQSANAYVPQGNVLASLGSEQCLKGRGNCIVYPKSVETDSGRILAAYEKATVNPTTGTADGETMPIVASDDNGTTWSALAEVPAPAYASDDPAVAKYVSNWTNPNFLVLPQAVGGFAKGTILLASVVSGDDQWYIDRKTEDPNYVPDNDGDRSDVAIALYSSTDDGASWAFENIIAEGGWQGGSAGAKGRFSSENTFRQLDPVWEPHLQVFDNKLVAYYSDENEYLGFDPATGALIPDPLNATASDPATQVLAHRTWDGSGEWSAPVVDVPGLIVDSDGRQVLGGGRPGMTTIAETTDGKYFMTFEYFGGGSVGRVKLADNPTEFFKAPGDANGRSVESLAVESGSRPLQNSGSPVLEVFPDGRIVYNADGNGDVWVNNSGRSDGAWTQYQTPLGGGYSRNIQYVSGTGRLLILQSVWGGPTAGSTVRHADVDLGQAKATYYQFTNKKTGQVLGTGGRVNDARFNGDTPDIVLEEAGETSVRDTQFWNLIEKADGKSTLLNKAGGREAAIWTGRPSVGQRLAQWVDNKEAGLWTVETASDGSIRLQSATSPNLYVTGASAGAAVTLQSRADDGSQDWVLSEFTEGNATDASVDVSFSYEASQGGLSISVAGDSVDLGQAQLTADNDRLAAEGELPAVRVTDTRSIDPGWSVSGTASPFRSDEGITLDGAGLGWAPKVIKTAPGQQVVPGAPVTPAAGLLSGASLAQGTAGSARGTADLGADLRLEAPTNVAPGRYTSTVTLTLS